jgi:mannose-1-phosphate guanylyltransferase/mannose-1-phosphate guanylyltransferase/mannose-6-phosphate isomerase
MMDYDDQHGFLSLSQGDVSREDSLSVEGKAPVVRDVAAPTIVPVVLSGGAGSRLWPFSTEDTPKQFLSFTGTKSLFELTLDRVRDRNRFHAPIVVASARHADLCERELAHESDDARLLLEPCARNTAPAIAMAAHAALEIYGEDCLLLVMPSDHVINDVAAFQQAIATAEAAARAERLVTFGIEPSSPDTGFGYIQAGAELGATGALEVLRFVEKPQLESAERMVAAEDHYWNAGIFLFRAGTFLQELTKFAPAITLAAEQAVKRGERAGRRLTADQEALNDCPSESVDYAVMEHSSKVAVIPMSPGWSDLGSWDALASLLSGADSHGPITALDCNDCFIRTDGLQVAALGVRDLIIVASGQRLLIVPRGRSQEVKKLLSAMETMAA